MRFVVKKVVLGQGYSPSNSAFHRLYHSTVFTYMLLLPEGQTGKAWGPSDKRCCSENGEQWIEKYLNFFLGLYSVVSSWYADTLHRLLLL